MIKVYHYNSIQNKVHCYVQKKQRLLSKPKPPAYAVEIGPSGEEGKKESIESYINSAKYKKYQKEYRNWIYEGDFNSNSIPTINKYFSVTDMPTHKIKN